MRHASIETISDSELAETAVVVTTIKGDSGIGSELARRCYAMGKPEPLVIVTPDVGDVRRVTVDELAETAVIIVAADWEPEVAADLAGRLRERCKQSGLSPAPLLLTVEHGQTVELAVTDKQEAEQVVRYLTRRFGL